MNGNYKLSQLDSAVLNALYDANRFNYAEAYINSITNGIVSDDVRSWFDNAAYINSNYGPAAGFIRDSTAIGNLYGGVLSEEEAQGISDAIGRAVVKQVIDDGYVTSDLARYITYDVTTVLDKYGLGFWAGNTPIGHYTLSTADSFLDRLWDGMTMTADGLPELSFDQKVYGIEVALIGTVAGAVSSLLDSVGYFSSRTVYDMTGIDLGYTGYNFPGNPVSDTMVDAIIRESLPPDLYGAYLGSLFRGSLAIINPQGASLDTIDSAGWLSDPAWNQEVQSQLNLSWSQPIDPNLGLFETLLQFDVSLGSVGIGQSISSGPSLHDIDAYIDHLNSGNSGLSFGDKAFGPAMAHALHMKRMAEEGLSGQQESGGAFAGGDEGSSGSSGHAPGPGGSKSGDPKNRDNKPVILDLNNDGISLTPATSSNTFFDTAGDGYQHRTAWAGAGDAVLAVDADKDGKIDQKNEIAFTEWDPTATNDLQALQNVFDTNHNGWLDNGEDVNKNGKLDAGEDLNGNGKLDTTGDDKFGDFKLMITGADGQISTVALSSLVNAIKLTPDATSYDLSDGSSIDGQSSFQRNDGTLGTAAAVSLATETQGFAQDKGRSSTTVGVNSTTIVNTMLNADGSIATVTTSVTAKDGSTRDVTFDDHGDGIAERKEHSEIVAANGTSPKTETITITTNAGVLIDKTTITTYANGHSIFVRDEIGGKWTTQTEDRSSDGNTITVTDLNFDGSTRDQHTTVFSNGHLTRTETFDLDGINGTDLKQVFTISTNGSGDSTRGAPRTIWPASRPWLPTPSWRLT